MYRSLGLLILFFFANFASAHHSMAEFDRDDIHELQGVVTNVSWRNPHVELELRVIEADGNEVIWEIEAQDINTMSRRGLYAGLVQVGDHVRVAGNASTRRNHVISVTNILLPNGKEIRFRGNPEPRWASEENVGFGGVDVEQLLTTVDTEAGKAQGVFRVWMRARAGGFSPELPLTDSARAHLENWTEADDPNIECTVPGMPASMRLTPPHPIDLVEQEDGNIRLRIEFFDVARTIHMNSDAEPQDQPASAQGYSVGHWEDDVLVVNTSRVNWPYFDDMAKIPQSEAVEMYERFDLNEDGTQMVYELTVTDPSSFSEPVLGSWLMDWRPDMEMQQYDCIPPEYK
jgi:hypothetical protein